MDNKQYRDILSELRKKDNQIEKLKAELVRSTDMLNAEIDRLTKEQDEIASLFLTNHHHHLVYFHKYAKKDVVNCVKQFINSSILLYRNLEDANRNSRGLADKLAEHDPGFAEYLKKKREIIIG